MRSYNIISSKINSSQIIKSPYSKLNNSDLIVNNSSNDDDIFKNINKEAQRLENEIISGNDIYDKYDKVTELQFKELIREKK